MFSLMMSTHRNAKSCAISIWGRYASYFFRLANSIIKPLK